MNRALVAILVAVPLSGCTLHNRVMGAGTLNTDSKTLGGELAAQGAFGDGPVFVGAQLAGHAGEGRNGASLLFNGELEHAPSPWGGRFSAGIGPAFVGDGTGELKAHFEVRGAFSVFTAFDRQSSDDEDTQKTAGVELFVSNIGLDSAGTFVGIGVTFGKRTVQHPGSIAASPSSRDDR